MSEAGDDRVSLEMIRTMNARLATENETLKKTGGDGTSGGMEARIARLESDMEHVKKSLDRLVDVPAKLAAIEVRVGELPSKDYLRDALRHQLVATGTVVGIIAAITSIASHFWH